ncbi:MAG: HEAT repeat domain-containing protein [Bacteroidota bacterium]
MTKEQATYLIERYNQGLLTLAEEVDLEQGIELGIISLEQLDDLYELDQQLEQALYTQPQQSMRLDFHQMLEAEKIKLEQAPPMRQLWSTIWRKPMYQWGVAALLVLGGIGIGQLWQAAPAEDTEIAQLSNQLQDMQEMMMLTLLEQKSTSKRLQAVSLTQNMDEASSKVTEALLFTLQNDRNVNVRLATLDALLPYTEDPNVRKGLVEAIAFQDSPLVQMAMAEIMVSLQEKSSIQPLQEIIDRETTPDEVKVNLKKNLEILL